MGTPSDHTAMPLSAEEIQGVAELLEAIVDQPAEVRDFLLWLMSRLSRHFLGKEQLPDSIAAIIDSDKKPSELTEAEASRLMDALQQLHKAESPGAWTPCCSSR